MSRFLIGSCQVVGAPKWCCIDAFCLEGAQLLHESTLTMIKMHFELPMQLVILNNFDTDVKYCIKRHDCYIDLYWYLIFSSLTGCWGCPNLDSVTLQFAGKSRPTRSSAWLRNGISFLWFLLILHLDTHVFICSLATVLSLNFNCAIITNQYYYFFHLKNLIHALFILLRYKEHF